MQIVRKVASFSLGEADLFRRAISKKDESKLNKLQDDFIQVVFHNIDNLNSKETLKTQIERIANHLKENEEMYRMLLTSDETLIFINRLNRLMTKNLSDYIQKHKCEHKTLDINFYVDGITSITLKYFRNELNTSIDELTEYTINLYERLFK